MDPTLFFDDWGTGSNVAANTPQLQQLASELAKQAPPPPPGSLQQMVQNPQMMQMMMGSLRGYGDERAAAQNALRRAHSSFFPSNMGTGTAPKPRYPELYAAARQGQAQPLSLGQILGGQR